MVKGGGGEITLETIRTLFREEQQAFGKQIAADVTQQVTEQVMAHVDQRLDRLKTDLVEMIADVAVRSTELFLQAEAHLQKVQAHLEAKIDLLEDRTNKKFEELRAEMMEQFDVMTGFMRRSEQERAFM